MLKGSACEWLGRKEEGPSALSAEPKSRPTSRRHCDSSLSLAVSTASRWTESKQRLRVIILTYPIVTFRVVSECPEK
jgi:hypothetical protein